LPRLTRDFFFAFYGGEPLLELDLIRETVAFVRKACRKTGQRPRFSITTNGSLVDNEVLGFFGRERFWLTLSYDGDRQDNQRRGGSGEKLQALIERLTAGPRIRFEINSVFTPSSVGSLSGTLLGLIDRGVPRVGYSLSVLKPWARRDIDRLGREVKRLRSRVIERYGRVDRGPVVNFRDETPLRIRYCGAGQDRMAVDTAGRVWGCVLFADYIRDRADAAALRRFSFGPLDRLAGRSEAFFNRTAARYARFSMDWAETSRGLCFLCPRIGHCWVCPVKAAFAGGSLTAIPDFLCDMQKAIL
jgi:sulfatase maturation enzyme AslB (radical SAM superfamily)